MLLWTLACSQVNSLQAVRNKIHADLARFTTPHKVGFTFAARNFVRFLDVLSFYHRKFEIGKSTYVAADTDPIWMHLSAGGTLNLEVVKEGFVRCVEGSQFSNPELWSVRAGQRINRRCHKYPVKSAVKAKANILIKTSARSH